MSLTLGIPFKPISPFSFLRKPIRWEISVGLNSSPVAEGTFKTSFAELDRYGILWGESLILYVGQHHSYYKNSSSLFVHPISSKLTMNPTTGYQSRTQKIASSGVIGGIGEVLLCLFFEKVIGLSNSQIAHITYTTTLKKSPDLVIESSASSYLAKLFDPSLPLPNQKIHNATTATLIHTELSSKSWTDHFPIECKTSKKDGQQIDAGLEQLLEYWNCVSTMNGHGIITRIILEELTTISLTLLLPDPKKTLPPPATIKDAIKHNKDHKTRLSLLTIFKNHLGGMLLV